MKCMINQIHIEDYRNERIDIHHKRECEIKIDELKDFEDSLIMGNEQLSTILEKELDEFIKSSVEDLVLIPSESEDTSRSDSEYDLTLCDDFSPINVPEGKSMIFSNPLFDLNNNFTSSDDESLPDEDVPEDKVKIYLNPLFEFDDEYISSDVNSLFDEVLKNIKNKDSYDSNLDEPDLLVTHLSDTNKEECFDPGDDIDEIELLLHLKMSRDMLTIGSIMRIPLLYRGEYSQWSERFMNYLEEQTDGEAMINCIKHGDQPLPRVTQVSIAGTSSTEQPPLKDKSMWSDQEKKIQKIDHLARSLLIQGE
uniref:Reverse transcriptase domain-containing protein n=1 Tax=Tanacetum cinerariifolium TaxID=118510 RepID=A0A6L2LGP8_TANCI|nr:hypothetical protein [Tanacetum cinerariifolium]